eukprot:TRINITY_DN6756_c0_g3_i1.p1 TRINITY_DN6756_c0_g3~~TRINITY_DN6756_c0_g3_i1.p1  ORF type:complete len:586 (-),score=79.80 TRINITY_DN6756_c0_g3_i1:56-1813(-)
MLAMSLGGMLLLTLMWTAGSSRIDERGSLGIEAVAFIRRESRFKVDYEHAQRLCTSSVVQTGCDVLGASQDWKTALASAQQLTEVLAASTKDVNALLRTVLGNYSLINREFVIREFCEEAVLKIPVILGMAAPQNPGLGCVNDECDNGSIDITEETLSQSDLATVPPPEETDTSKSEDIGPIQADDPAARGRALFRGALNVVFGIFPAVDENEDEPTNSLLQEQAETEGPGADVAFGSKIRPDRHSEYRASALKASAWISTALRRIRSGRDITKKWFVLRSEAQVDAQIVEARMHLMKMLTAIGNLKIRKGPSRHCKVTDRGGTLAYVMATVGCSVQSTNNCGEGRSCSSCGDKEQGRYVVNICEFYWQFDEAKRTGTIVHESSHHFGTDDKAYCSSGGCLQLSSVEARDNADSYTHFVKELVQSSWLQAETPATHMVPHPTCNTGCNPIQFQGLTQLWRVKYGLPHGSCGRCEEVSHVKLGPYKLWGDDCEHGYRKAKSSASYMLCCKPYKCEEPTTTTTTTSTSAASCPYPSSLSGLQLNTCKCPSTQVCYDKSRRQKGCGYKNDRYFSVFCRTCACQRYRKM